MPPDRDGSTMTIGELSRRSGVAVNTIRAWEQRYGLLTPERSAGGHRRYGSEDLRRLLTVQTLVAEGVTLPTAARRVMADATGTEGVTPGASFLPVPSLDPIAMIAAYRATRSLLFIQRPQQAVDILIALVRELGGAVVPADDAPPEALPLDLSLGERSPLLPVADPYSVARLHLERVLPTVLEDARRAATLVRRLSRSK